MEGEEEKGLDQELPTGGQRRGDLVGCRGGTVGVADRKEQRRCVLERERERRTGIDVGWERRKELDRGPENGIDRRKRAPQPNQSWLKTDHFPESSTAALPILQGLLLNFMTSFTSDMDIYTPNIMTSKQSTIQIMVMTLSWPFEMILKHNIISF